MCRLRPDGFVQQRTLLVPVFAHRDVVRMVVEVHVRHGQPEPVRHGRVEGDAIRFLREVLPHDPQPGRSRIPVDETCEVRPPPTGLDETREERRPERDRLEVVPADESPVDVEPRFVRDEPRHRLPAVHPHRIGELRVHRPRRVSHVVPSELSRGVREAVGEQRRGRHEQQPGCLDRIPGDRDDARLLCMHVPVDVDVEDAVDASFRHASRSASPSKEPHPWTPASPNSPHCDSPVTRPAPPPVRGRQPAYPRVRPVTATGGARAAQGPRRRGTVRHPADHRRRGARCGRGHRTHVHARRRGVRNHSGPRGPRHSHRARGPVGGLHLIGSAPRSPAVDVGSDRDRVVPLESLATEAGTEHRGGARPRSGFHHRDMRPLDADRTGMTDPPARRTPGQRPRGSGRSLLGKQDGTSSRVRTGRPRRPGCRRRTPRRRGPADHAAGPRRRGAPGRRNCRHPVGRHARRAARDRRRHRIRRA